MTLGDLGRMFPRLTVDTVDAVTVRDGEPYRDAVDRAAAHEWGRWVKLVDNAHNSHPQQLAVFPLRRRARKERKYAMARSVLLSAVGGMEPLAPVVAPWASSPAA